MRCISTCDSTRRCTWPPRKEPKFFAFESREDLRFRATATGSTDWFTGAVYIDAVAAPCHRFIEVIGAHDMDPVPNEGETAATKLPPERIWVAPSSFMPSAIRPSR